MTELLLSERREEVRLDSQDIIRWKRPGRLEDNKAWTVDRSPSGYGFMTRFDGAPRVGDLVHIRRFDNDRWAPFEEPFKVARLLPATDELVVVGCRVVD
ncbi:MAG TPA: hypothetical protein VNT79_02530 [Phycisphaerae bacterium]|nr:hypothetical protein [Phycisphaerae bacterium]